MAGSDPQKQLRTLIRDFATEKSQGERKIVGLKKRIHELQSELDAANAELEDVKRLKENNEQELKGYEVELAMTEASIQTLEGRICFIQNEISVVGSDVEALKNEEGASRDEFIAKMFELNAKIRKFQETLACTFHKDNQIGNSSNDEVGKNLANMEDAEVVRRALENKLDHIISQINMEEQEYQAEQNIHKQTSEFEEKCASLGEELQRRCVCPSCHSDNVEQLGGILQASDGN
ncbi:uncharacterized protein LOC132285017 isoform X2 [Cornus florida]|uniref:uncharacterized protein LOC132285017 isoform X2 n=1 Tax=Cornus florida TaxID=4283 RepID=UPI002897F586|nr:uncharacterized protein LOC132285017 isoform X2 [Cornus florida]XP_059643159.1 uncharacterized protein LOC132285017 isoform X2 [Cornus florida]